MEISTPGSGSPSGLKTLGLLIIVTFLAMPLLAAVSGQMRIRSPVN
jgi:hypothetical protein